MIGKTLQLILDEKGTNVNELSNMIGVSNQTLYSIIKRDNMKIDFEVLLKICRALNVSVERFYSDYCDTTDEISTLTPHEKKVIFSYRNHPDMQKSVDRLLDIDEKVYITKKAARNGDNGVVSLTSDQVEEIINSSDVDEDI